MTAIKKSPVKGIEAKTATMKAVKEEVKSVDTYQSVSEQIISIGRKIKKCQSLQTKKSALIEHLEKLENPSKPYITFKDESTRYSAEILIEDEGFYNAMVEFIKDKLDELTAALEVEIINDKVNLAA